MAARPPTRSRLSKRQLRDRAATLRRNLSQCTLCPHECRVNRLKGEHGVCRSTDELVISSAGPHFGEEPPLVGRNGSGTIIFAPCNLKCQYCQNFDISQSPFSGREVTAGELATIMLELQHMGCHNINLVSPTHVAYQIPAALLLAAQAGLRLPVVYNTGGYDSLSLITLL